VFDLGMQVGCWSWLAFCHLSIVCYQAGSDVCFDSIMLVV
jgi:hypothetical protein